MPSEAPQVALSRDINDAHPKLKERFERLLARYREVRPGRDLMLTCVYRSPEEQNRLYKIGRGPDDKRPKVTNCDGIDKKSNHNYYPSHAVDVAIVDGGKVTWSDMAYYDLGPISREVGLSWGGYWTSFQDYPHLELFKEDA